MSSADWGIEAADALERFAEQALAGSMRPVCSGASNSIGTHVFLEFGELTFDSNRSGEPVPCGDLSLGVHAYHWELLRGLKTIATSDSVTPAMLDGIFEDVFSGKPFPAIELDSRGTLRLEFEGDVLMMIYPHADGADDDYYECEIVLQTRDKRFFELLLASRTYAQSLE